MSNKQSDNNSKSPQSENILYAGILLFALTSAGVVMLVYSHYFSGDITYNHEKWGQLGDFFGGVLNPIFAFLALIALLYTIKLQVRELRETKEYMGKTALAAKKQNEFLKTESKSADTYTAIKAVYNDYLTLYSGTVLTNLAAKRYNEDLCPVADRTLKEFVSIINKEEDTNNIFDVSYELKECNLREVIDEIRDYILLLHFYLMSYQNLGYKETAQYYRQQLHRLTSYLQDRGILKNDDEIGLDAQIYADFTKMLLDKHSL